jgi:hypothetical protein
MVVYRIRLDVDRYQFLLPADPKVSDRTTLIFDCKPRAETWVPPKVYVQKPLLERGNFLGLLRSDPLICDDVALAAVGELLHLSGELLPLPHEGETFHVLNALECVNALDRERTRWYGGKYDGPGSSIVEYAFHPTRIPETPIFKIPDTYRAEILTAEHAYDHDYEFKPAVERMKLTGLKFVKLWSDED